VTRLAPGAGSDLVHLVGDADTAAAMGSGDVAALGRALEDGQTTVGSRIELEHLAASPVGTRVTVRAELTAVDGRLLRFDVSAQHPDGTVVARGRITRVVVDRAWFLERAGVR
jgi:predicted thioesterase